MADRKTLARRLEKRFSVTFRQPLGSQIAADATRGYYIDMRVKATSPDPTTAWPWQRGTRPWVGLTQMGLGAFERYLAGEGEQWRAAASQVSDELCQLQVRGGTRDGAWEHTRDYPHTFVLHAPWISAMAQGQAASLLVRTHLETGNQEHAAAALRAVRLSSVLSTEGGASGLLHGRPFPQEYPTDPPSFVLNGGIYAMWGWRDVGLGLADAESARLYDEAVDTLAANIHRYDTGWWSRYDLFERRLTNTASFAYHELHVNQLTAMQQVSPRAELGVVRDRFAGYLASAVCRARALGNKAAFRVVYPRAQHVAARHDQATDAGGPAAQ